MVVNEKMKLAVIVMLKILFMGKEEPYLLYMFI